MNPTLLAGVKMPWPEMARFAARFGYPGVDVALGPAMADGVANTRALLERLKIRPGAIGLPVEFRKDDAAFEQTLAKLAPAAEFAAGIGCPRMATWVMASSETPKAELRATFLKRFGAVADVLRRSGVSLGLEFLGPLEHRKRLPHEFIWRMSEMLAFARECGPNVGLLLDSWHWHHAGATVEDILAARERVVHVHINDAAKQPPEGVRDNQRLLPGDGVINLTGFFRALDKIGYRDAVSIEVFGAFLKEMGPEKAVPAALAKARAVMEKAGVRWNA
ncbi:MAG: sugar phosphate isomerase/epimerase family protein [Bryobacteraceae bacterium]